MKKISPLFLFLISLNLISQNVDIPDPSFKEQLLNHTPIIDSNNDGEIQFSEAEATSTIEIIEGSVNSLEGINAFSNLQSLTCICNIDSIDLSSLTSLETLIINGGQLEILNLDNNLLIKRLELGQFPISELNLSNNIELEVLRLGLIESTLSELDISENIQLKELLISSFLPISEIDTSNNLELEILVLNDLPITNINVSNNLNLKQLSITRSLTSQYDLSNNINLEILSLFDNDINDIDVVSNVNLKELYLQQNLLSDIDVSQNGNLEKLGIDRNSISYVDVSTNSSLSSLSVSGNPITNLDVQANINLRLLSASECPVTSLDLSNNPLCVLIISNNEELEYVNLKNGFNTLFDPDVSCIEFGYGTNFMIENTPNLISVCVDDISFAQEFMPIPDQAVLIEDCTEQLEVDEVTMITDLKIYPNPVSKFLNIDFYESSQFTKVEVYTIFGSKIKESSSPEINMEGLTSGMYILKIYTLSKETLTTIIKN